MSLESEMKQEQINKLLKRYDTAEAKLACEKYEKLEKKIFFNIIILVLIICIIIYEIIGVIMLIKNNFNQRYNEYFDKNYCFII